MHHNINRMYITREGEKHTHTETDRQTDRLAQRERERGGGTFSERMTLATLPVTSLDLLLYISRQHAVR